MLMITYCFFLRDMLEPQVPQERLENEEQEYVPPLLSAFCFIYLFFFISNIILKNALSPFSLPGSFSRGMSVYSPLIVGWSIAKNPREQLRGKLILLREVLASLSRKIPERNQVTFAQQKSLLKECLLHSTIYLISFFKGAPGIFGTPGGDGDSGLAVSVYFFLPISSGRGGGEGMKEKWKVLWA